jgi:2-methylcitrate dehydratase PrpD
MADSISRQFARWASRLTYDDLPVNVRDKVQALILHALTAAVLGAATPEGREAVRLTKAEEAKADGATILTDEGRATRVGAAFAGAELIHASGLLDSYRMLTHPGPVLVPAGLVNAELEGRTGRDLITALAAGYEFLCRLCDDYIPSTAARGFRPSPLYCTLGAALVAGKLMGLDEDGLVSAIALATNFASGLNEGPRTGSGEMAIHEPQAARNGAFAGVVAREGHIRGAETAIEGEAGFYNAFTGNNRGDLSFAFTGSLRTDSSSVTAGLGSKYKLLTVMFRMYPVAGYNQAAIDLMAEMKSQHGIDADKIAQIAVSMNWIETLYPSPAFPRFADWNEPRIGGTHYYVAYAAVHGGFPVVGAPPPASTDEPANRDSRVVEFMRRVTLAQERDRAMFSPAIRVTTTDGNVYDGEYPYARMEWNLDQLVERMQGCLQGYSLGKIGHDRLVAAVQNLADSSTAEPLLAAVSLSGR